MLGLAISIGYFIVSMEGFIDGQAIEACFDSS